MVVAYFHAALYWFVYLHISVVPLIFSFVFPQPTCAWEIIEIRFPPQAFCVCFLIWGSSWKAPLLQIYVCDPAASGFAIAFLKLLPIVFFMGTGCQRIKSRLLLLMHFYGSETRLSNNQKHCFCDYCYFFFHGFSLSQSLEAGYGLCTNFGKMCYCPFHLHFSKHQYLFSFTFVLSTSRPLVKRVDSTLCFSLSSTTTTDFIALLHVQPFFVRFFIVMKD